MPTVSPSELARYLSITPGRVTQLCHAGVLSKLSRGKYDLYPCVQAFINFKVESAINSRGSTDVNEARKKLYDIQTVKTELETERTRRETIAASEHVTDMRELQKIFGAALDGLDNSLACDIAELNDAAAVSERLTRATNNVRQGVADAIVEYAATVES